MLGSFLPLGYLFPLYKEKSEGCGPSVMLPRAAVDIKVQCLQCGKEEKNMLWLLKGKFRAYESGLAKLDLRWYIKRYINNMI